MKKEITLNILASYLPYTLDKLKMLTKTGKVVQLDGIKNANVCFVRQGMIVTEEFIPSLKLILRPMSDLYKEGEHLTTRKLNRLLNTFDKYDEFTVTNYGSFIKINELYSTPGVPSYVFEKYREELLKDKFDYFNLISSGLAVEAKEDTYVYNYGTKNSKPLLNLT